MASQARIDANRRNAQRSTGPKTEAGKARAKLNALKDGSHAKTVSPVLPQEDPIELERRINQWISDLNPRNDAERELVIHAANLSWELDRTSGARRLAWRTACARRSSRPTQRRMKEVGELGRRLLYNAGAKTLPTPGGPGKTTRPRFWPGWRRAPRGAAGCSITGSALRVLLDRDSAWTYGDMFRLIRLLGKYPVEAINDPKLNAIFLAWDAVVPGWAERFWKECKQCKPLQDPGFSDFGRWREIADRPADAAAAISSSRRSSTSKWPGWRSCWKCTRRSPATRRPSWPTGRRLTAAPGASGCGGRRRPKAVSCGRRSSS